MQSTRPCTKGSAFLAVMALALALAMLVLASPQLATAAQGDFEAAEADGLIGVASEQSTLSQAGMQSGSAGKVTVVNATAKAGRRVEKYEQGAQWLDGEYWVRATQTYTFRLTERGVVGIKLTGADPEGAAGQYWNIGIKGGKYRNCKTIAGILASAKTA